MNATGLQRLFTYFQTTTYSLFVVLPPTDMQPCWFDTMRASAINDPQGSLLPTETTPPKREIIRIEKNLNTFGFFTPSSKRLKVPSKSVSLQVRSEDGRRIEAKA